VEEEEEGGGELLFNKKFSQEASFGISDLLIKIKISKWNKERKKKKKDLPVSGLPSWMGGCTGQSIGLNAGLPRCLGSPSKNVANRSVGCCDGYCCCCARE